MALSPDGNLGILIVHSPSLPLLAFSSPDSMADVTIMTLDQVNMCIRGPVGTVVNIQTMSEYGARTIPLTRR